MIELSNDTRKRVFYAEVVGLKLRFTITQEMSRPIDVVKIEMVKNEVRIGEGYIYPDGRYSITFDNPNMITSFSNHAEITAMMFTESEKLFNETIE